MFQLTTLTTDIETPSKSFFAYQNFDKFFYNLLQIAIIMGTIAALFFLLWGAIEFITSGGNQERNKSAKNKITEALTGLAILAAVWIIWRVATYFLGLSPSLKGPFKINVPSP